MIFDFESTIFKLCDELAKLGKASQDAYNLGLPNVSLLRLMTINLLIKIYKFKPILTFQFQNRSISPLSKPQRHSEFSVDDTCILDIIFIVSRAKIFRYVFIIRSTCSKGH